MRWTLWLWAMGCLPQSVCPPPGTGEDFDGDGFTVEDGDCDDEDAERYPGAVEWCDNGVDEDCDGVDNPCALGEDRSVSEADVFVGTDEAGLGHPVVALGEVDGVAGDELAVGTSEENEVAIFGVQDGESVRVATVSGGASCCGVLGNPGDVTGDGVADLLIGRNHLYLPLPDEVSSVYLVAGPLNENLAVPNDAIELFGRIEDSAGEALGGALDFNGDGQNDVLIGAPALMGNRVGGAFVVHGPVTEDLDLDSADSWFEGVQPGYGEGRSVAGVADMNGDGRDEVLMGQSGLQGGQGPHVAWLFLGGEGSTRRVTEADDTFSAEKGEYSHPMTVTGLGDVDGDGYGDCALGSTVENNYEGKVWVIAGGLNAGTGAGLDAAIATIDSEQSGDRLGAAIAGPGDLNGDGFAEVLIGMPEASLTDVVRNEGRNTLLYGPLIGRTDVSLESSSIRVLSGELEGQRAGQGLGAAGDVNGDGYVDLFLSSSALGGQAWIFFTGLAETGS